MQKMTQAFMIVLFLIIGNQLSAQEPSQKDQPREKASVSVGEEFSLEHVLTAYEMEEEYRSLKPGDTLRTSFQAEVTSVCKNKGCWMKLALADGTEVMVNRGLCFFCTQGH